VSSRVYPTSQVAVSDSSFSAPRRQLRGFGRRTLGSNKGDRFSCFCLLVGATLASAAARGPIVSLASPSLGPSGTSSVALSPIANLARPAPVPCWPVQPCSRSSALSLSCLSCTNEGSVSLKKEARVTNGYGLCTCPKLDGVHTMLRCLVCL
jgi:hypothetical protein